MLTRAQSYKLLWDFAIPESLNTSQKWVLSAMQSYGDQLITMLWRILGNEQDVCDAYQDTFLHLAHFENGSKPDNIKAYVFRSAGNTAISILRRRMIEKKNLPQIAARNKENSETVDLDSNTLQLQLRNAITKLPDLLRDIVTLHDLAELPYIQVAKILGITEGSARVYRHKAVQLLAVWMNKEE
ncbi:MAG: sigma-70 family RNA polymerase sigma factor [Phycisphaerales bacterium]